MNIEPDSIILPRLIPWITGNRVRLVTFEVIFAIAGIVMIFVWVTRFFSPLFAIISLSAVFLILMRVIFHQPLLSSDVARMIHGASDFCPECGSVQIGSRYCPDCGRKNFF
jgi:hypothetical protein